MISNNQFERSTYFTHGFHPYPAKFTPQLVNKYLSKYCKPGDKIIDPFCGSGTALVEGILNGIDSIGIDLNPIAYVISKAKTNIYSEKDIAFTKQFLSHIQIESSYNLFSQNHKKHNINIHIPNFYNRDHWFQKNVSIELATLKKNIEDIENQNVRDLLICAFSKIIVKVSNQDSEVRYTAKNKNHPDGIVFDTFYNTVKNYIKVLESNKYNIKSDASVYLGDTTEVLKNFTNNCFDFIITSPPYINTFDYYLYHKQRMFWLGFDHKTVRNNEIGNHHRIDSKSFQEAKEEYITLMTNIMHSLSRVSKPNSIFIMIIGDGIVNGTTIDMSQVISEICNNCEYNIKHIESINLANITRSFNRKFSNATKHEHYITLINKK